MGDALDDAVRGLRHAERAIRQVLNGHADAADPWTLCLPKILTETMESHVRLVAALAAWEAAWWTRRLAEIDRETA